jgi:hypothetical protein
MHFLLPYHKLNQTHYYYYGSTAFCLVWPLFQFCDLINNWQDSLDGGSARHKAATYTQVDTEQTHADINASIGVETHNPSVERANLRPPGNCDQPITY